MAPKQRFEREQNWPLIVDDKDASILSSHGRAAPSGRAHVQWTADTTVLFARCNGQNNTGDEYRGLRIMPDLETTAVSFDDIARSIKAKAIVAVFDAAERFASPIFGRAGER